MNGWSILLGIVAVAFIIVIPTIIISYYMHRYVRTHALIISASGHEVVPITLLYAVRPEDCELKLYTKGLFFFQPLYIVAYDGRIDRNVKR